MGERKTNSAYADIKKRIETFISRTTANLPVKILKGRAVDLGALAREVITKNLEHFRGLFHISTPSQRKTAIKRVYSREEIRILVQKCLIQDYKTPTIIDAVTDYLYDVASKDQHMPPEH